MTALDKAITVHGFGLQQRLYKRLSPAFATDSFFFTEKLRPSVLNLNGVAGTSAIDLQAFFHSPTKEQPFFTITLQNIPRSPKEHRQKQGSNRNIVQREYEIMNTGT